ncbi:MAG: DUF2341 domain-containing protein, partial [Candidatus Heimdallarchaeota archaeon]
MAKKTKSIIIITFFLLGIIMPFVDAIAHTVYVNNPDQDESFSYATTNVVFSGWSHTTGLTPSTDYICVYDWYIDSDGVQGKSKHQVSTSGGVLAVIDLDVTVDVSTYDIGEHDTKLRVKIRESWEPYTIVADDYDTHDWSRDEAPLPPAPSVEFTVPENPYESYDYSTSTSYTCEWTITDEDDDITVMNLYMDDALIYPFGDQPEGDYSFSVTMDTDKVYTLKVNGTDSESNDYSTTTHVVAYNASQYIDVNLPEGQYHNSEIVFQIENGAPDGLHNMSYSVGDYSFWDSNNTSSSAVEMADTYNYTFSNTWSRFVNDYETVYSLPDDWYSSSWGFRKKLTFTSDTVLTSHQINYTIIVADSVYDDDKANGDDWVMTTSDGVTIVNHWVESYDDSGTSVVWFRGSLINGDTIFYLYYGNAGASNSEDPLNIFLAWDDFDEGYSTGDSPLGARNWTNSNGTPTIETAPFGVSNQALRLEDDAVNYDETRNDWGENVTVIIHFNYYIQTQQNDIAWFSTYEGTDTITTSRVRGNSDDIAFYDGVYKDFVPNLGWTEDNLFELNLYIRDNDYDINCDGTDHEGILRSAYSTGVEEIRLTANWGNGAAMSWVDDFYVRKYSAAVISLAKGNELEGYDSGSHTITENDNKGLVNKGTIFTLDLNTSVSIYVNVTIILMVYETIFEVYSTSALIVQTDSFTLNDSAWSYLSEDWFSVNISCYDDLGSYYSTNLTYYKDTASPMVWLYSPENRTVDDPYSNLQIIPLDYKINDTVVPDGSWTNDMKWLTIDGETFTGDDWIQYPKYKPLQFWEGLHNLTIRAKDWAGNVGEATAGFYYEARLDKPLELTFTGSIDSETIDPELYLNIYLDGMPISAVTTTNLNDFDITVYDKFGILLNSTSFDYS